MILVHTILDIDPAAAGVSDKLHARSAKWIKATSSSILASITWLHIAQPGPVLLAGPMMLLL